MTSHTYRVIEVVGTSTESIDEAIHNGVARAAQTIRRVDWFEVTQTRGHIRDGRIEHVQVGLKLGFRLEDESAQPLRPRSVIPRGRTARRLL
jgi:flavin-binding protein dodecin